MPPEHAITHMRPTDTLTPRSRFRGCLLGGAVGDALGAPVEFLSYDQIRLTFGEAGITELTATAHRDKGDITDDTQMTLFTAEGLLRGWVRGHLKGITDYAATTAHAYLRWLLTQGMQADTFALEVDDPDSGWLIRQPALHHQRAPGNTCLDALQSMATLGEPALNDSKGCGGVMRVAPVGLFAWHPAQGMPLAQTFALGCTLAGLTHGHPTGTLSAGVLAVLIQQLADGRDLRDALAVALSLLTQHPAHEETLAALIQAETCANSMQPAQEAIAQLGTGWVAEEALAIAVYCALVAEDFRHGVTLAVNHDGDSDSTGAIAGNLLGAQLGEDAIPAHWREALELREVIATLADDLLDYRTWGAHADRDSGGWELIWQKYPGS